MLLALTIAFLVSLGVLGYFWNMVLDFINESVRPWVKEKLGSDCESLLVTLTKWLDDGVCLVKRSLKSAWEFFKTHILRMRRSIKVDAQGKTATSVQETIYRDQDNQFIKRVEERKMAYDDLPPELRHEMIRQGRQQLEIDEREIVEHKAEERAEEQGLTELLCVQN